MDKINETLYDVVRQCCVYVLQMFPPDAIRNYRSINGNTLLHAAVVYCPEAIPILAKYIDVNARNEYCRTALDIAAIDGNVEAVRLLLELGADLAAKDDRCSGETPLHGAAYFGHVDVVKLLLSHGADPNIRNRRGATPLHYAVSSGNTTIIKLLIDAGADVNAKDREGRTPLHYTAYGRKGADVVKLLVEMGADVNARDNKGNTPLHVAAEKCNIRTIKELLKVGADPTIRNNEGLTPRDLAAKLGYMCIAEMLRLF